MDISVVIPCHQAGKFIEEAVDSVRSQKGNFILRQIIIVDDASNDAATLRALHRLSKLPNVEVYSHKQNKGPGAARNTGITKAKARWITFLDADDVLTADSLEIRLQTARAFPSSVWIGGDFAIWDFNKSIVDDPFFLTRPAARKYTDVAFSTGRAVRFPTPIRLFLDVALTNTCSSIYSTGIVRSLGGFSEKRVIQEDYHLFMRLSLMVDFVFVPTVVFLHRRHETNLTKCPASVYSWRAAALKELLKSGGFEEHKQIITKKVAGLYLERAYSLRKSGKFGAAAVSSAQSALYAPFDLVTWRCFVAAVLRM